MENKVLPARFVFAMLGFLGFFIVYAMRINFSVAVVAMVKQTDHYDEFGSKKIVACQELLEVLPYRNSSAMNHSTSSTGEFEWDSQTQGIVLGAFFYGYVITQIPAGLIAGKYGAKWLLGTGMLFTSIFTLLTPLAARWNVWALVFARVVVGLGAGVSYPAMNTLIGQWAPKLERSRITSFIYTGSNLGTVFTLGISGMLCDSDFLEGWPSVFYLFGAIGCVWFIPWAFLVRETPEDHPRISKEELQLIRQGKEQVRTRVILPWKSVLTSVPFWALAITHCGETWGLYTLLIEMPMYLSNILHFDLHNNGFLSALPHLMLCIISITASILADKLRESGRLRATTIRKIFNTIGYFGPAICLLTVAYIGCSPFIIVGLLSLAMGLNGFAFSGFIVTFVDMSPDYAGTLYGISNFFSNFAGFLVPAYVGWIIQDGQTVENWGTVFITASVIFIITGTVFNVFASAELQPWGVPRNSKKDQKIVVIKKDSHICSSKF